MMPELAESMSQRGRALQRTFAAAFEAAKEHAKTHPHEVAQLFEMLASHLRSAAPMALGATAPVALELVPAQIEPETSIRVDLGDGAAYHLAIADAFLRLQMFDVTGDETMHHFEPKTAKAFRDDLTRVLAAMGVR